MRATGGVTWQTYHNDQWRPLEERRASHPAVAGAQYFWGARHRDDLVRRDRAPTAGGGLTEARYVLMDYFSAVAITNGSTVVERYAYRAFGERVILNASNVPISSSIAAWEFGSQGQFEDAETNWLNYGYRYYLPHLGRFASKDPIGEDGGWNLYAARPLNSVDYLGLIDLGPTSYSPNIVTGMAWKLREVPAGLDARTESTIGARWTTEQISSGPDSGMYSFTINIVVKSEIK